MKAKHLFVHLVKQQTKPAQSIDATKILRQHIRETLSAEQLTQALKHRLVGNQKKEALSAELGRLEQELLQVEDTHDERVIRMRKMIQELKKKL